MNKSQELDDQNMTRSQNFYVVGIGASAGGLEALEEFFENMPVDSGMAFVVVQHLSPDFKSLMDQLLARKTRIPIDLIEDGAVVQPNRIYLLPPKKEAILSNGELLLAERAINDQLTFPIDHFFRSLAQDKGSLAIGVILSGTGSDGSRGILDIHAAGGLVIVQNENSAKFDGMPRSACDTGIVDMVLTPREIASALRRFANDPAKLILLEGDDKAVPQSGPLASILTRIRDQYTLDFSCYKTPTISRRIERRLVLSGAEDVEQYAERIATDDVELDNLYRDLLIGVTNFFRDKEVFNCLQSEVIPDLVGRLEEGEDLRVWVAACATGEEAYSIAILISEYFDKTNDPRNVRIFASDVHQRSLDFASRGVYSPEQLADVSEERLRRYFIERPDGFYVSSELRKMIVFTPHNVLRNAPFTRLDLVTCRNMLIYLTPAAQKKVLSLFHFGLKRGGILCLGSSETTGPLIDEFAAIHERSRIYRKQRDIRLPNDAPVGLISPNTFFPVRHKPMPALMFGHSSRKLMGAYDCLLEKFMPPSILISSKHELLHAFRGASKYFRLRDGRQSTNVLEMILPELQSIVNAALRRIESDRETVRYTGIRCRTGEGVEDLSLTISLVGQNFVDEDTNILIQFEPTATSFSPPVEAVVNIPVASISTNEIIELERELRSTKDDLQATIEELQATNEELQSSNEELTGANEELQSTNEELHSVNEELYTVNAEHQRKIDELTQLTDDMDNLFDSTNIHTVFLDRDLCLRRFTPSAADIFNLIPQDIGRRFDNFSSNLKNKKLVDEIATVVDSQRPYEREVQDEKNSWYLLRIWPYLSRGEMDGVVITLIDIDSLKNAEARLTELSEIVEQSDDAIYRLDMDGIIRTWNRGATRLYGYHANEVINSSVSILTPPELKHEPFLYLDRIRNGIAIDHVETRRQRKNGTILIVSLTVSPLWNDAHVCVGASVVSRDVTKQKQAENEIRDAVRQRDQFLALLSHELRNPLSAIVNALSVLKEDVLDEESDQEARHVVDTQLKHVARMLDDLLDVARITNDKLTLHLEVVDLKKSMRDAIECVHHQLEEKQQELFVESPNESVFVKGDVGRLQQAQVNLLVNASKYSPRGSAIHMSLKHNNGYAELSVRDQGQHIPEALRRKIFQPFVQADDTLDRSQGGMGLGLPLVNMIAAAHGGTTELIIDDSHPGNEFRMTIPITNDEEVRASIAPDVQSLGGVRLLLVEDNASIRNMLARTLVLKSFEVETAANGNMGLKLFDEFKPDVAIIDIGLPDIDGYEIAKRIRSKATDSPVTLVAVTGYGRDDDVQKALTAGFDLHLLKPIDPDVLIDKIGTVRGLAN